MTSSPLMIVTGRATHYLSAKICEELRKYNGLTGLELCEPYVVNFANDNVKVKINESVRGADVFVVQTAAPHHLSPRGMSALAAEQLEGELTLSDNIMELLILVDALRSASAGRITVVCPYFPYVRSDKKDEPHISITARLMADLFKTAGADRVLSVNLHALQIQGFFSMPCDQLDANPLISEYLRKSFDCERMGIVATDAGGVKIATVYAEALGLPLAVCDKRRVGDKKDPEITAVIGIDEVKDRHLAIFDDEIMTGGTIVRAIEALSERFGLPVTYVTCVHPAFDEQALNRILMAGVKHVITTDTLPPPTVNGRTHVVSTAALLAGAIFHIHTNQSVTKIFEVNRMLIESVPERMSDENL